MKILKIAAFAAILLGICVMVYAGRQLMETQKTYQEGNLAYDDISGYVRSGPAENPQNASAGAPSGGSRPAAGGGDGSAAADAPGGRQEVFDLALDGSIETGINFEALKRINNDAGAWLYSPDTVIDYPVMAADDYDYYLHHLPDGTKNANGSLFIDYNCAPDFSDALTVIYGHHMKSGRMFGSLNGYKKQVYYDEHPYMFLYTEQGNYMVELLYGCVIGAGQWTQRAFMYPENAGELLDYAASNTTFNSGAEYREGDRLVALATCSYEFDEARYIVLGILRE